MFAVVYLPGTHWKAVQRVRDVLFHGQNKESTLHVERKRQIAMAESSEACGKSK